MPNTIFSRVVGLTAGLLMVPALLGGLAAPAVGQTVPLTSSITGGGPYEGIVHDGIQYPGGFVQVGVGCILTLCIGSAKAVTTEPVTGKDVEIGGGFFLGIAQAFTCNGLDYGFVRSGFYLGIHTQEPFIRTFLGGDFQSDGTFRLWDVSSITPDPWPWRQTHGRLTSGRFLLTSFGESC